MTRIAGPALVVVSITAYYAVTQAVYGYEKETEGVRELPV